MKPAPTLASNLNGTDEVFLENLDSQIWKIEDIIVSEGNKRKKKKWKSYNRSLTETEWNGVKLILEKNIFAVEVSTFRFGFTCGIDIIKVIEPTYPLLPFEFETILSLESYHLPGGDSKFDEGWEKFYPFFNNKENIKELKRVGLEIPKAKKYYDY